MSGRARGDAGARAPGRRVDFHYGIGSRYSYLASARIASLEAERGHGGDPIDVGRLDRRRTPRDLPGGRGRARFGEETGPAPPVSQGWAGHIQVDRGVDMDSLFGLGLLSTLLGTHRTGLGDAPRAPGGGRAGAATPLHAAHLGLARQLGVSGSRQAGFHATGPHFYTWQEERREAESWAAELAPLEDDAPQTAS